MSCGFVEFSITDGTVVIDLLAASRGAKAGFGMQRYTPGRPQLKDGGIWSDEPFVAGRQLTAGFDTNIVEAVTLICGGPDQDFIIRAYEELDLLLQKMRAYWTTNWQQTPVYIRARAKGEIARRYAMIRYAKFDDYFEPYGQLFAGGGFKVCTEEFVLGIERGPWLDLPPGESESVPVTHNLNSGTPIDVTTPDNFVTDQNMGLVIGNMNGAGLLSVYRDDGGSFSSNLLSGSPPYNLVNSTPATNDAAYFGSFAPFFGLIFDFTSTISANHVWEFWNGSAWTTLTVNGAFAAGVPVWQNGGIRFAHWSPSLVATWAKTVVGPDMTNLYWVRLRITANGTGTLTQGNRHIYATTTTYVEVADDEVVGTQGGLSRIETYIWQGDQVAGTTLSMFMGLRSVDRGEDFVSQLNVGSGNPSGVTVTAGTADPTAPGGQHIAATNLSTLTRSVLWKFTPTIMAHYFGQFRVFARIATDDDTGASQIRYQTGVGSVPFGTYFTTTLGETKSIATPGSGQSLVNLLVDLGYLTLPLSGKALYQTQVGDFHIGMDVKVPAGKTIKIYTLILLPVDEWTGEITGATTSLGSGQYNIILDAITNPKSLQAYANQVNELHPNVSSLPFLHAGAAQRLWFLWSLNSGLLTSANFYSRPSMLASVRLAKVNRNISLRRFPL